jgi:peptidoglycan/xylan/chitin deacetylase (PgdA/CDA1 family)
MWLLEYVASSEWRRQRLLILCYHSISVDQEHLWRRPLFFTLQEFEERLQLLRRWGVSVLPLGVAVDRLREGTLPPRSAVLTFDDGTADFFQIVWPLLKQYGYPATVYATTYYGGKGHPVFPLMCSYLIWKARHQVMPAASELGVKEATALSTGTLRALVERSIIDHAQREDFNADEKNRQAARLAQVLGIDYEDLLRRRVLQLMTTDEIREVAADGADVELHTHRHRAPRRRDLFDKEIEDNRMRLEPLTRVPAEHFCYPSGVHYPEFLPWLTAQHIKSATTCVPGLSRADTSLLLLPRVVDTMASAPVEFEGWLSGLSEFLPRRSAMGQP